jgi:hypothetical protein
MMFFRAISRFSTSATRHATKPTLPTPLIKKYPVYLHLIYPSWDTSFPTIHQFGSAKEIKTFLSDPIQFLVDSKTGNAIRHDQIHMIDPNIIYDVAGSGLPDRMEGNLKRDQVRDKVFKRKAAMALREALQAEDQKLIELSRVVKDPATGLNVDEWEVIFQGSDGSIIFLETQSLAYQMSKVCYQLHFSNSDFK